MSKFRKFVCIRFIFYLGHTLKCGFHEAKKFNYMVYNCVPGLEEVLAQSR